MIGDGEYLDKHIVFYSGGLGSWATLNRVVESENIEDVICLFTDTFIEDDSLYKFILESTSQVYNVDNSDLIERLKNIPPVSHESMKDRKLFLSELGEDASLLNENLVWINDGRDVWEVFRDNRFLGNSRIASCSHQLKQDVAKRYLISNHYDDECTLYLGIDWTEAHRTKAPVENWYPYTVKFPMCEKPFLTKIDHVKKLEELKIEPCKLYSQNFSHANCGGFCVKGGQGHFINLLENNRELYMYHEEKEIEMINLLSRDVSIITRQEDKVKNTLTLRDLRLEYESGLDLDKSVIGGCGCFSDM